MPTRLAVRATLWNSYPRYVKDHAAADQSGIGGRDNRTTGIRVTPVRPSFAPRREPSGRERLQPLPAHRGVFWPCRAI